MRRLIVLAALALGACGGGNKDQGARPPVPDVASNFSQPLDARGADPQWGLRIRGQQLTLDRPNQPDLVASAPGAVISAHAASWTGRLPDGRSMKVSLYASQCADAAGDLKYPFSAEVLLPDSAPLNGCAGAPASAAAVAKR
ncbi:MAG TPA: hypothetical protein VHN39_05325 [Phenylobacterium sp.]|jgi:uncharacterized membrane protein|nr:hypothetical protein [Phenylobacterium sp.]